MTSRRGAITGPVRLVVAARQQWVCSSCNEILSSAFEVDHTIALVDGGEDSTDNATAMCANCHAKKTQREHIKRSAASVLRSDEYDIREDTHRDGVTTCQKCRKRRPIGTPHPVCWAIEPAQTGIANALSKFRWQPPMSTRGVT